MQITALVACLPVIVLGMGAALAHLVHETPAAEPTAEPVEHDQDDAEAWTERAVIVNALRDQHTDQPAPADTEPIAPAETATPIRSAEADQARRPTKAPDAPVPRATRTRHESSAKGTRTGPWPGSLSGSG